MTEIHLGIMQYASALLPLHLNPFQDRNDYSQRSSDNSSQPNSVHSRKAIAELEEFVEILLGSTFGTTNSKEDGCLVVLDLLATIVNCMKSIELTFRENDSNIELQTSSAKSKSGTSIFPLSSHL